MIVAFDTSFLNALFGVSTIAGRYQGQVDRLVNWVVGKNGLIVIPAPAWTELLVGLQLHVAHHTYVAVTEKIIKEAFFEIMPFDQASAGLLAEAIYEAHATGSKKGGVEATKQIINFDRQIVAVAKAHKAEILYTNDKKQARFAKNEFGLEVRDLESLD